MVTIHAPQFAETRNERISVVRAELMIPLSRPAMKTPMAKIVKALPCRTLASNFSLPYLTGAAAVSIAASREVPERTSRPSHR